MTMIMRIVIMMMMIIMVMIIMVTRGVEGVDGMDSNNNGMRVSFMVSGDNRKEIALTSFALGPNGFLNITLLDFQASSFIFI
jgi:hypothetical protein